jgi:hypothetical protein
MMLWVRLILAEAMEETRGFTGVDMETVLASTECIPVSRYKMDPKIEIHLVGVQLSNFSGLLALGSLILYRFLYLT